MKLERWEEALDVARSLCEQEPNLSGGYIHTAYCLHELGLTEDARRTLLEGPQFLRKEAVFYYNLGCYQTQLGDLNDAKRMLKRSFDMDEKLRAVAKADPDLEVLWVEL